MHLWRKIFNLKCKIPEDSPRKCSFPNQKISLIRLQRSRYHAIIITSHLLTVDPELVGTAKQRLLRIRNRYYYSASSTRSRLQLNSLPIYVYHTQADLSGNLTRAYTNVVDRCWLSGLNGIPKAVENQITLRFCDLTISPLTNKMRNSLVRHREFFSERIIRSRRDTLHSFRVCAPSSTERPKHAGTLRSLHF